MAKSMWTNENKKYITLTLTLSFSVVQDDLDEFMKTGEAVTIN